MANSTAIQRTNPRVAHFNSKGPYPFNETMPEPDPAWCASIAPPGIDPEMVRVALAPFNGRARHALAELVQGGSRVTAAARAGLAENTIQNWRNTHPEFDAAWVACLSIGTTLYEVELHSRALAGKDDRGSMRALELVAKARNPDYRDKSQVAVGVVTLATEQLKALGAWRIGATDDDATLDGGSTPALITDARAHEPRDPGPAPGATGTG